MTFCLRCGRWRLLALGTGRAGVLGERPALLSGARYFVVPTELPGPGLPFLFLSRSYVSSSSVGAPVGDFRVMEVHLGSSSGLTDVS